MEPFSFASSEAVEYPVMVRMYVTPAKVMQSVLCDC